MAIAEDISFSDLNLKTGNLEVRLAENNLEIDYEFYITNQIMKPVQQLFALVLENIPEFNKKMLTFNKYKKQIKEWNSNLTKEQADKKIEDLRNKEVKKLLFDETLNKIKNKGKNTISSYFT